MTYVNPQPEGSNQPSAPKWDHAVAAGTAAPSIPTPGPFPYDDWAATASTFPVADAPPAPAELATAPYLSFASRSTGPRFEPEAPANLDSVRRRLTDLVRANRLESFYDGPALADLAWQVSLHVDFKVLAREMNLSRDQALELSALALYDVVVLADDSGSMRGKRWSDLQEIFGTLVNIARRFDQDGLGISFLNHRRAGRGIASEAQLNSFLDGITPSGGTRLGTTLDAKILREVRDLISDDMLQKPVLVLVITDGAPTGEDSDATESAIIEMDRYLLRHDYPGKAVAYGFSQVGDDADASAWLDALDNHPEVGDRIDAVSDYQAEAAQVRRCGGTYSPGQHVSKMLLGAIDPRYDDMDAVGTRVRANKEPCAPILAGAVVIGLATAIGLRIFTRSDGF